MSLQSETKVKLEHTILIQNLTNTNLQITTDKTITDLKPTTVSSQGVKHEDVVMTDDKDL